jgi:hypothetical protein
MIEALLEYQICSSLFKELLGVRAGFITELKLKPADILLTSHLKRVEADIASLSQIIQNYRPLIISHLEGKHKVKFEFISMNVTKEPIIKS